MMTIAELYWPHALAILHFTLGGWAACHALLTKSDTRSAVAWIGLVLLSPLIGSVLYIIFGINRVARRAQLLRSRDVLTAVEQSAFVFDPQQPRSFASGSDQTRLPMRDIVQLAVLGGHLSERKLLRGNRIEPLTNGDEAYPAMARAIDGAHRSIAICSFIFRDDEAGGRIIDALERAKSRGVEIRVLIDGIGSGYFRSPTAARLRQSAISHARFLHSWKPWKMSYINLRSHKKVLVIDGKVGFTGGMNIGAENLLVINPRDPVQDMHFRVDGPVVAHLLQTFIEDWAFTTGEELEGEVWHSEMTDCGPAIARGLSSGPDEENETIQMIIAGALGRAIERVRIVTPYFLPDERLVNIIRLAALRGIRVDIVLPVQSNHRYVQWAMKAHVDQFMEVGCIIHLTPDPFDHTKLMTVDDWWTFFGSANWDSRSLRLNFEFNVECYDREFTADINRRIDAKIKAARPLHMAEIESRSQLMRLRDSATRLMLPYL